MLYNMAIPIVVSMHAVKAATHKSIEKVICHQLSHGPML